MHHSPIRFCLEQEVSLGLQLQECRTDINVLFIQEPAFGLHRITE